MLRHVLLLGDKAELPTPDAVARHFDPEASRDIAMRRSQRSVPSWESWEPSICFHPTAAANLALSTLPPLPSLVSKMKYSG